MKKWLKRIGSGLAMVILIICAITYVRFAQWRQDVTKDLERDSTVVQTAKGPIEYAEIWAWSPSSPNPRGPRWLRSGPTRS